MELKLEKDLNKIKEVNVFIDFEIIKNSPIEELRQDLDTIIQFRNKIYVWSKIHTPMEMRKYCLKTKVPIPKEEIDLHKECFRLRNIECLSYDEIREKTGVSYRRIGFFAGTDPNKQWNLDDWIADYFKKDTSMYSKVDFIIDPSEKMVKRFEKIGIPGNVIEKL